MKKSEIVAPKYLPKIEARIAEKFEKVYMNEFSSLHLNEEELHDLKQILKFLLSKEEQDTFTKKFDINRVRKYLISDDERLRQQAFLVLQVLREMGQFALVASITTKMKMSIGVKELILREPSCELQATYQNCLNEILSVLDDSIMNLRNIKNKIDKYNHKIAEIKVSLSGEAKEFILGFSDINNGKKSCTNPSNYSEEFLLSIFIYAGELEEKLKKVTKNTWGLLINSNTNQDLICYYISSESTQSILSQEKQGFTCKTLNEVLANVKKARTRKKK